MTNVCKCITCKHVAEMKKLIPNEALRNKVLTVTDDLYEAMASSSMDKDMEIIRLKAELKLSSKDKIENRKDDYGS